MRIHQEEFDHATQASRVRLNVYEEGPGEAGSVYGMGPAARGYLVTEDRVGTTTVVATLGFFSNREDALALMRRRAEELRSQNYRSSVPAA